MPKDKRDKAKEDMRIQILKELSASGMLPQNRISLEVLYLLPQDFIEQYTTLFFEALREDAKGTDLEARAGEMTQTTRSGAEKVKVRVSDRRAGEGAVARGAQGEGTKRYRNAWVIRNEKALKLKGDIDGKLRDVTEDIIEGLKPDSRLAGTGRRCKGAGCGRFLKNEWRYCPSCGESTSRN